MPHIFITGATGFVGGDALYAVVTAHPEYSFSALVRSQSSAEEVTKKYPHVKIVLRDLDDVQTVESEAKKSDVVLNLAASNHIASVKAITSGLASRTTGGTLIQISGASILSYKEISSGTYGEPSSQVLDDIADLKTIASLTASHPSRRVDTYLLTLENPKVKTAIVCAPCIYGAGRGPVNTKSMQIPDLVSAALKSGQGIVPGPGKSRWGTVHVADLSALFVGLLELSLSETTADVGGSWGEEGYYFPATDEKSWGEVAEVIATEAHAKKLIKNVETKSLKKSDLDALIGDSTLFGISARVTSSRARKVLGWRGHGPTVQDDVVRILKEEAEIEM